MGNSTSMMHFVASSPVINGAACKCARTGMNRVPEISGASEI